MTGLLVAEVNVNTMCELGSGGVSLVSKWLFLFSCAVRGHVFISEMGWILTCEYKSDRIHFCLADFRYQWLRELLVQLEFKWHGRLIVVYT